jgi:hypothetical protein
VSGQATSGYITDKTKFIFRSRSANMIALFQMSKEMWEFADDGELYFEKAISFQIHTKTLTIIRKYIHERII